MNSRLL